jgi:hypothetical protein
MRGWSVELNDGTLLCEDQTEWKLVPKNQIKTLSLHFDGRRWDIYGQESYFVKTGASMVPGIQESLEIEEHCIGYYQGNQKIFYVVNARTGHFHMEVRTHDGK